MLIIIGLFLSSHHLFQVYYKVRQHILLQSPGWSVITKCDSLFIIKCDNFIAKCDRYYKVQQNIPQAKISRIPEYGVQSLHGANIWTYMFHGSWMWKTKTITKTKQTNKNQTKQNNRRKAEPICTRVVTIGDSSFANLDSKTLLRMTARERVRSVSTGVERSHARATWFRVTWDQAQFERFSYILSNGYRWNWAWYKLLQVCARYGQILAVTLIGC